MTSTPPPIMPEHDDRTKPRALTVQELLDAWTPLYDNELFRKVSRAPTCEDIIPEGILGAKSAEGYPPIRTRYGILSNDRQVFNHNQRAARLRWLMESLMLFVEGDTVPAKHDKGKEEFKRQWELVEGRCKAGDERLGSVSECLEKAEEVKAQGNEAYGQKDMTLAVHRYVAAWFEILPYHIDAFPIGDPSRNAIAVFEAKLFNNLIHCFYHQGELVKDDWYVRGQLCNLAAGLFKQASQQIFGFSVKGFERMCNRHKMIQDKMLQETGENLAWGISGPYHELILRDIKKGGKKGDEMLFHMDSGGVDLGHLKRKMKGGMSIPIGEIERFLAGGQSDKVDDVMKMMEKTFGNEKVAAVYFK